MTISADIEPITHAEARQIADRYNNSHWYKHGGERARYSIPADPKRQALRADIVKVSELLSRARTIADDDARALIESALAILGEEKGGA